MRVLWGMIFCLRLAAGLVADEDGPTAKEQARVLAVVTGFAHDYLTRLPDFNCIRTTRHFLGKGGDWRPQVKVASELSYYDQSEHYRIVAVDGVPKKKVSALTMAGGWIETDGNFGWVMKQLFDPQVHAHFEWQGWDEVRGKRALVFKYHVDLTESTATSTRCVGWVVFNTCRSLKYGFHGLLFVSEGSTEILRISHVPENLPANYAQGESFVEYGRVTVAGTEYLLPVADGIETTMGKPLYRNLSTYGEYRKFVADSTLKPAADQ
jgi:hypothetical protein